MLCPPTVVLLLIGRVKLIFVSRVRFFAMLEQAYRHRARRVIRAIHVTGKDPVKFHFAIPTWGGSVI